MKAFEGPFRIHVELGLFYRAEDIPGPVTSAGLTFHRSEWIFEVLSSGDEVLYIEFDMLATEDLLAFLIEQPSAGGRQMELLGCVL